VYIEKPEVAGTAIQKTQAGLISDEAIDSDDDKFVSMTI